MAVRPRGPGKWQVELRGAKDPRTGKYRRYAWTMDGTEKEARTFEAARQAELDSLARRFVEPSKETVASYLTRWLTGRELRPKTRESYDGMIRLHIIPALGSVALCDLNPAMVQGWLDNMRAGRGPEGEPVSNHVAAYCRRILGTALREAVRLGSIEANWVERTRAPKTERAQVDTFTLAEVDRLIAAAAQTRFGPLVRFVVYAGLRRGEALGMRWEDVDLQAATVAVRRQRIPLKGGAIIQEMPKTASGARTFTLPTPAVEALKAQRRAQVDDKRAALKTGTGYTDDDWVFTTAEGGPCDPRHVSRAFERIRKRAKVRALPLHATRHTAASLQIAAGVPLEIISKRLGHRRVGITADLYGHLLTEADKAAAKTVDAFLAQRARPAHRAAGHAPRKRAAQ